MSENQGSHVTTRVDPEPSRTSLSHDRAEPLHTTSSRSLPSGGFNPSEQGRTWQAMLRAARDARVATAAMAAREPGSRPTLPTSYPATCWIRSYRQSLFVERDLGKSSGSAVAAARRAGHLRPDKLGPQIVWICLDFRSSRSQQNAPRTFSVSSLTNICGHGSIDAPSLAHLAPVQHELLSGRRNLHGMFRLNWSNHFHRNFTRRTSLIQESESQADAGRRTTGGILPPPPSATDGLPVPDRWRVTWRPLPEPA